MLIFRNKTTTSTLTLRAILALGLLALLSLGAYFIGQISILGLGFILLVLLFIGVFIFRPMLDRVRQLEKMHWVSEGKFRTTFDKSPDVVEEIRRRNRELELLNRVIAASATSPRLQDILETTCRELAQTFNVTQVAAALLNKEKTEAVVVTEYRAESRPSSLHGTIFVANDPILQYLLTHKAPLMVEDAQNDLRLASLHNTMRQHGTVSLLMLPLIIKEDVIGGLGLETNEPRRFTSEEVNLAWSVADQVSGALARVRLIEEHRRLSTAIEQTAEGVVITNTEGTILYVNPAFEQISGYRRAEVIGQNPRLLKSGRHDAAFYQELWTTITSGEVWHGRFTNKKKNGAFYIVDTTITPVRDESGAIVNYVNVHRDVTRRLQLEEQYRQAQKMDAIGQLTAGITHDFNNLLTVINGFTEMVQFQLPPDDPLQEMVGKVLDSGQRAADLVGQLLAFSRKQIIEPRVLDLNEVVAEMDKMLQRIIGEGIEMRTSLSSNLWWVRVDPAQIEQVIVNLAINARDAMPEGGQLTIETANVVLDDVYAADHLEAQPGEHVLLAVSDTGYGMSKEVQARIFEPFFTTKGKGQGTGLGLATVFGIVKQNGGNIWVYSEEGQGTTFKIYLPPAKETMALPEYLETDGQMPPGSETILLVEDDITVRDLGRRVLERLGYTLLEAQDAQEALHLSARYSGPIHLLLTDVIMPGISGKVLAEQLSQTHPNLKILFVSGYTDSTIEHHGVLNPGVAFLQKPFTPMALARKIREVLDA